MNIFKKHQVLTLFSAALILIDIFQHNFSLSIFVLYVWAISLLLPGFIEPNFIKGRVRAFSRVFIWGMFAVFIALTTYVQFYLPHGPSYSTGEEVCQYDGRQCGEEYKEDTRELNIPDWAKFWRDSYESILLALLFAGITASVKDEHEQ